MQLNERGWCTVPALQWANGEATLGPGVPLPGLTTDCRSIDLEVYQFDVGPCPIDLARDRRM